MLLAIIVVASPQVARATDRIVSLVPSVTETLFALGVGDEVVGVSSYDDYPPQVIHLPRVGSFLTPESGSDCSAAPDDCDRARHLVESA